MKTIFFTFAILAGGIRSGHCGQCPNVSTIDIDYGKVRFIKQFAKFRSL